MMSLEVLKAVNNGSPDRRHGKGLSPMSPSAPTKWIRRSSFPNIGTLEPRGWRKTDAIGSWTRPDMAWTPNQP